MTFPYTTGDTPTTEELNEVFGSIQGKTSGNPIIDPKLILKHLDLKYGLNKTVASNTTIALGDEFFNIITGGTNIENITLIEEGIFRMLKFSATLKILTSGNIRTIGGESLTVYENSVILVYQFNSTEWIIIAANNELVNATATIPSAATISVSKNFFYIITGTTDINRIEPIGIGKKIRLLFQDTVRLTNADNIKNAGNLDFYAYENVTVDLYQYDANNWVITNSNKMLTKIRFLATMSADQTIANNTVTKVDFDTEVDDTHGAYDPANQRFVVPVTGLYLIQGKFQLINSTNGSLIQAIIRNNGGNILVDKEIPGSTGNAVIDVSEQLNLTKNDQIEIWAYHESVGSRNIDSSFQLSSFSGILLN